MSVYLSFTGGLPGDPNLGTNLGQRILYVVSFMFMYTYIYIYICIYKYVYIYIYTYKYISLFAMRTGCRDVRFSFVAKSLQSWSSKAYLSIDLFIYLSISLSLYIYIYTHLPINQWNRNPRETPLARPLSLPRRLRSMVGLCAGYCL